MEPLRQEIVTRIAELGWLDRELAQSATGSVRGAVYGICLGLGLGIVSWVAVLVIWYVVAA